MHSNKFRVFTKLIASVLQSRELLPKYQSCRSNRYISKDSKYYTGFNAFHIKKLRYAKKWQEQPKIAASQVSFAEKLASFKANLGNCKDPVKKYDCLVALRGQDIDLYYRYLCDNTVEVFSILSEVDSIVSKIFHISSTFFNNLEMDENDWAIKKLENPTDRQAESVVKLSRSVLDVPNINSENCSCLMNIIKMNDINLSSTIRRNMVQMNCGDMKPGDNMCAKGENKMKELRKCLQSFEDVFVYVKPYCRPFVSSFLDKFL